MGTDTLEDRAVELLGQIQASVGESVRAMNELGALRRREADEAHRQHDAALTKLDLMGQRADQMVKKNEALARGSLTEAAERQARAEMAGAQRLRSACGSLRRQNFGNAR